MEKAGVISKVSQPTPWCAGMVVVPKKNGKVCICVDLKPLNHSVLREVHPLPKVDKTLARLSGAKIFSKLDANSGFGKFLCHHHHTSSLLPSLLWEDIASTSYHSEYQVPQKTFNAK